VFDWFNKVNTRVYLGQQMTGIRHDLIYRRNFYCTKVMEKHGIMVLSPVTAEGVKPNKKKLNQPSQEQLTMFWKKDKWLIRHSHVLLDITGPSKSQGLLHEIGYARYHLFKPIVRIMKVQGPSVAIEEDDLLVKSVEEAAKLIVKEFGTPLKRLIWKFRLFGRCFFPYIKTRIAWFVDWV
jgi:hypothetical protein